MKTAARSGMALLVLSLMLAACAQTTSAPAASGATRASSSSQAGEQSGKSSVPGEALAKPSAVGQTPANPKVAGEAPASASAAAAPPKTQVSGGDPNGYPIRVSYAALAIGDLPFYAALDAGFFQQQHLAVTMIMAVPNVAITALSKGEIQFSDAPINAIDGAAAGLPLKVVFSAWEKSPWTLMGKQEFKSLADLKGKTISTGAVGSVSNGFFQAAVKQAGLAVSDYHVVSLSGTAASYSALLGGTVDAAVVTPPFDAMAEQKGFRETAFLGDALQAPYVGLVANAAYIRDHRPQVISTLRALTDASRWLSSHPAEAADLVAKYVESPPDIAKRTVEKMLRLLNQSGEVSVEGIKQAIEMEAQVSNKQLTIAPDQVVDYGPLHEALGKQ